MLDSEKQPFLLISDLDYPSNSPYTGEDTLRWGMVVCLAIIPPPYTGEDTLRWVIIPPPYTGEDTLRWGMVTCLQSSLPLQGGGHATLGDGDVFGNPLSLCEGGAGGGSWKTKI